MDKFEEFIDKKFGKLIVIKYVGNTPFNSPLFECKCECGNTTYANSTQLRNGKKKSCGCLKKEHRYEYKKQIADLEAKLAENEKKREYLFSSNCEYVSEIEELKRQLAESEEFTQGYRKGCAKIQSENVRLKQQLAEHSKHHEWVSEFLERYKIDPDSTPEYSKNPMIEYCEQVYDFRLCDNVEIKDLQEQLADYKKDNEQLEDRLHTAEQETLHFQNKYFDMQQQLAEKEKEYQSFKEIADENVNYLKNRILEETRNYNQDKISFCIEKLEKVREFCEKELKECDELLKTEFEDDFYIQSVMARESMCFDFRRTIDQQIKQLKEGK